MMARFETGGVGELNVSRAAVHHEHRLLIAQPPPKKWTLKPSCDCSRVFVRWTPHPVIVTIGDNREYIRVLLCSHYTTIPGWGFLLGSLVVLGVHIRQKQLRLLGNLCCRRSDTLPAGADLWGSVSALLRLCLRAPHGPR